MGLSPIMVDKIFEVVNDIHQRGTTILLVEQNASRALQLADARLRDGLGRGHDERRCQALLSRSEGAGGLPRRMSRVRDGPGGLDRSAGCRESSHRRRRAPAMKQQISRLSRRIRTARSAAVLSAVASLIVRGAALPASARSPGTQTKGMPLWARLHPAGHLPDRRVHHDDHRLRPLQRDRADDRWHRVRLDPRRGLASRPASHRSKPRRPCCSSSACSTRRTCAAWRSRFACSACRSEHRSISVFPPVR